MPARTHSKTTKKHNATKKAKASATSADVTTLELDPRSAGGFTTCLMKKGSEVLMLQKGATPECTGFFISNSAFFRMVIYLNYGPGCNNSKDGGAVKIAFLNSGKFMLDFVPTTKTVVEWQKRIMASRVLPVIRHAVLPGSPLHARLVRHLGDAFKGVAERVARSIEAESASGYLKEYIS